MSQFSSHYRLTAWAVLAPGCNESAGKKKSVKISRAGVYLKPALVEVAHCAVVDKECTYYANKYNILAKRRGKKRAIIAIARKILVAIYHMLSTGETFNPSDLFKVETSDKDKIKYTKNNFLQSTKQLFSLGLSQDEIILLINSQYFSLDEISYIRNENSKKTNFKYYQIGIVVISIFILLCQIIFHIAINNYNNSLGHKNVALTMLKNYYGIYNIIFTSILSLACLAKESRGDECSSTFDFFEDYYIKETGNTFLNITQFFANQNNNEKYENSENNDAADGSGAADRLHREKHRADLRLRGTTGSRLRARW